MHLAFYPGRSRPGLILSALDVEAPAERMYGHVLHYTGCRPTEALQLTVGRVLISEQALVLRSLKKRKIDRTGQERAPQYRTVPVPAALIESLDLVFNSVPGSGGREAKSICRWSARNSAGW